MTDLLDQCGVFRARLFRESCVFHQGCYVKDLSRLGRDLNKTLILDNSPASYIFHPNNAVSIISNLKNFSSLPFFERWKKKMKIIHLLSHLVLITPTGQRTPLRLIVCIFFSKPAVFHWIKSSWTCLWVSPGDAQELHDLQANTLCLSSLGSCGVLVWWRRRRRAAQPSACVWRAQSSWQRLYPAGPASWTLNLLVRPAQLKNSSATIETVHTENRSPGSRPLHKNPYFTKIVLAWS